MKLNKIISAFAAIIIAASTAFGAPAAVENNADGNGAGRVRVPLNLAVLIQDDVTQRVGNELERTREFIRRLPAGSRVMVGYVTSGSLQVRQSFTTDLESAAKSLRLPVGNEAASPYNPFVEVREALKKFPTDGKNFNALLLVSDGLDVSRGFGPSTFVHSIDLESAVREAQRRGVAVYTFYAPTQLTASSRTAANRGQSALNRLTKETGGQAFFQGTDFVSFDPYFRDFSRTLNRQFAGAI
ncbi:MAG TPA: hypothetical protein VF240_01740 [Pyrinomonadaceae bacterium]